MSNTDLKPKYALWAALLDNPYDKTPKSKRHFEPLTDQHRHLSECSTMSTKWPNGVLMVQRTWKEKRLSRRTLPRAAAIQGVRQYLLDGNRRNKIPKCGSLDGNLFRPQHAAPSPSLITWQWKRKSTVANQKYASGEWYIWNNPAEPPKTFVFVA